MSATGCQQPRVRVWYAEGAPWHCRRCGRFLARRSAAATPPRCPKCQRHKLTPPVPASGATPAGLAAWLGVN